MYQISHTTKSGKTVVDALYSTKEAAEVALEQKHQAYAAYSWYQPEAYAITEVSNIDEDTKEKHTCDHGIFSTLDVDACYDCSEAGQIEAERAEIESRKLLS